MVCNQGADTIAFCRMGRATKKKRREIVQAKEKGYYRYEDAFIAMDHFHE